MKPIFIILLASIVTIVLTLFVPGLHAVRRRRLAAAAAVGALALLLVIGFILLR